MHTKKPMNWQLNLVMTLSLLLLINIKNNHFDRVVDQRPKVNSLQNKKTLSPSKLLFLSFNTGLKSKKLRKIKKKYQKLYMAHLFTPSGLHLAPFSYLLLRLFGKLRLLPLSFFSLLYYWILQFSALYSIQRILLMHIGKFAFPKLSTQFIFSIVFLWDFIGGTFKYSPLSFTYSFIFLSAFIFSENKKWFFALIWGQLLISTINGIGFNPLYFLLGVLLSSFFSFIFPLIFLSFTFSNFDFFEAIGIKLTTLFNQIVEILAQIPIPIEITKDYCFFLFIFPFFYQSIKFKKILFLSFCLIMGSNLNTRFDKIMVKNVMELKNKKSCKILFLQHIWVYRCRI
jgi:competence protein ComEC